MYSVRAVGTSRGLEVSQPGHVGQGVSAKAPPQLSPEGQAGVNQGFFFEIEKGVPRLMDDSPAYFGELGWAVGVRFALGQIKVLAE